MKALSRSKLLLGAWRHAVSTHAALSKARRHQHSHQPVPAAVCASCCPLSTSHQQPLNTKKYNWIHYFLFYDLFHCAFNLSCKRWGSQAVLLPWTPSNSLSQAPLICYRAQDFMRWGSPVSWEQSLPLINSSRLLPPCHGGGGRDVLPNCTPSSLFYGLTVWPSQWLPSNSSLKRCFICELI